MVYSDLVVDRGAVTADFNNYLLPGIYCYNGEPSILNAPGSVAGNMEVIVTTKYVIQRITVYDRTYTRRYNGSVWTDWASYLTNADIDGHLYCSPNGPTGIDGGATGSQTKYRLQINNSGDINIYKSTDGGKTWPGVKKIASFET